MNECLAHLWASSVDLSSRLMCALRRDAGPGWLDLGLPRELAAMTTTDYAEPAATLSNGRMPLLGFGTWQIDNADAVVTTGYALEAGYRHIDTATAYGNEAGIGKALASAGLARESVFVTTKLPPEHAGRERRTLSESLSKLGLDFVDLWLVHWPPGGDAAPKVWEQLIGAQQEGLAKAISG